MQGSDWSLPTDADGEIEVVEKSMASIYRSTDFLLIMNQPSKRINEVVERHCDDKTKENLIQVIDTLIY